MLRRVPLGSGWRPCSLKFPQLITKNAWQLLFSFFYHNSRQSSIPIIFCYDLSKLFPFDGTSRILMSFEYDIADNFRHELVLFLSIKSGFGIRNINHARAIQGANPQFPNSSYRALCRENNLIPRSKCQSGKDNLLNLPYSTISLTIKRKSKSIRGQMNICNRNQQLKSWQNNGGFPKSLYMNIYIYTSTRTILTDRSGLIVDEKWF